MSGFYPISPLVGITNTSYGAQAGVMDNKWAVRVVRGKKILAEKTINDLDLDNMVGVIFGHARIEGLSRHAVAMCAGRLMQFARQYQQSGLCPNYEIPDLLREGEEQQTAPTSSADRAHTSTAPLSAQTEDHGAIPALARLGAVPQMPQLSLKDLWLSSAEARGALSHQMACYGATLPEGHLQLMFDRLADDLISMWAQNASSEEVLYRFGAHIQSCSKDSQVLKTGSERLTIETGACELLASSRRLDPAGSKTPKGYPCAFHEMLAAKLSSMIGLKVSINTSSTGCIVTVSL
ncbi:MAG: hypothetical protein HXY34_09055 [Candidatus Thorarchaeota archaeon]|nr:hypothetical protein [Candidatus Thorarchaeota archaeon]